MKNAPSQNALIRHPSFQSGWFQAVLLASLWTLLSLVAFGCGPAENEEGGATAPNDTVAPDSPNQDTPGQNGVDSASPRLPPTEPLHIDADDCGHGTSYENGAPMDFVAYVQAADDFVLGRVDQIEPVHFPFQPDRHGEIPADECEPDMVQPAIDLTLTDVWSARGSVESSVTIRLSGNTWSKWGAYPEFDESRMDISWAYEPNVEVPPIVPGMTIGGAVYRHAEVASLWFNTMSEPLLEVVGDEVVVQEGPGRVRACAPVGYIFLANHAVADAWNGLSVDEWTSSVVQILSEDISIEDVSEARRWALNPYHSDVSDLEVHPTHARAYCRQRTLRNDWFCDDGVRPFICPNIDGEACECECTTDCLTEGETCMPDNTCAMP